jgi:hypothetical protein
MSTPNLCILDKKRVGGSKLSNFKIERIILQNGKNRDSKLQLNLKNKNND